MAFLNISEHLFSLLSQNNTIHYLFSEHERDDFKDVKTILSFVIGGGDEEQEVLHAGLVQHPQHLIVNTDVAVGSLLVGGVTRDL